MLWIFQVFALSASLYGCQIWATNTHVQIVCYNQIPHPPCLLSEDALGCETTNTHCLLRETGQLPLYYSSTSTGSAGVHAYGTAYWQPTMPCWARSMKLTYGWHWKESRTFEVLSAFRETPGAEVHIFAITCQSKTLENQYDFWTVTAWANHMGMERSGPHMCVYRSVWWACFQQSHEDISHPFWSAYRESNWLVGW